MSSTGLLLVLAAAEMSLCLGFSASPALRLPLALSRRSLPLSASATRRAALAPSAHRGRWSMSDSKEAKPFVCTTPLYYANGPPHMGSAYPTMAADVIAQYYRLKGAEAAFVTGSDEHGEKIATTATDNGKEPQEFVDGIVDEFKALWSKLGIRYDSFIRTTDPKHEAIVREFFQRVWDKGDIYKKDYTGHYCVGCEAYLGDDEMETIDGVEHSCKIHRKPAELRTEENYFFKLSAYQTQLEDLFRDQPDFVQPAFRFNEVKGWVDSGVPDFSISRATIKWGIPVPEDKSQVIYVWFDALLGYISALVKDDEPHTLESAMKGGWPCDVHIIGKDILRFHAVYWPAMLMSAGVPLPRRIYSHGFLTKDGLKMGKSLGNVLEPNELVDKYGSDAVRWYFTKGLDFGGDGDFSEERFVFTVNADLANDVGNLLNRCLKPLVKNIGNTIPDFKTPDDHPLRAVVSENVPKAIKAYEALDFQAAGEAALQIARAGNKYMDENAPWSLFKDGKIHEGSHVLLSILEATRICAILLSPIVPDTSRKVFTQLGFTEAQFEKLTLDDAVWRDLPAGQTLPDPEGVFSRLEAPNEKEDRAAELEAAKKKKADQKAAAKKKQDNADVPDVLRLDIRVGKVLKAEKHPEADSLYIEQIDCGDADGPRTIVSGLAKYMPLEELEGRLVTVVCNLKPAKLKGVESAGMVLAAGTDTVELVDPPAGSEVGERLKVDGMGEPTPDELLKSKGQMKVWDRVAEKLATSTGCAVQYDGKDFVTSKGPCTVKSLKGVIVK